MCLHRRWWVGCLWRRSPREPSQQQHLEQALQAAVLVEGLTTVPLGRRLQPSAFDQAQMVVVGCRRQRSLGYVLQQERLL